MIFKGGIIGGMDYFRCNSYLTLKPAENFSEMRLYTIWACMVTLGGVTQPTNTLRLKVHSLGYLEKVK